MKPYDLGVAQALAEAGFEKTAVSAGWIRGRLSGMGSNLMKMRPYPTANQPAFPQLLQRLESSDVRAQNLGLKRFMNNPQAAQYAQRPTSLPARQYQQALGVAD